ncbi:MAG: HNH endonuclease [Planctomycetaceae bacterium]|nr:HNH endonuclease [Planctomycetaceae bacterium]
MAKQVFRNTLYTNDNLYVLSGINSGLVDLIYLDPPFNSKRMYSAPVGSKAAGASFKDMWTWKDVDEYYLDSLAAHSPALTKFIASVGEIHGKPMMAYLTYVAQRIIEMYRILKPTGSIYLHCDSTASHYLKILLDFVFGKSNFRNEIIWCYKKWSVAQKAFSRNHDTVLLYTKSSEYCFNLLLQERAKSTRKRFGDKKIVSGFDKHGRRKPSEMEDEESEGVKMSDWWEIPIIAPSSKERTGYPTQKPLKLLKRIIQASSNEGDVVMDPFCGCATTCVAAQQLDRKWIGIDIEKNAANVLVQRLRDDAGFLQDDEDRPLKDFIVTDQIPKRSDLKEVQPSESVKQRLYKEQAGRCNSCGEEFKIWNLEIDHIIPKTKGGGDYYENYQLLCGSCNRIKGDRPMEYLRMKIETRERMMKSQIFFGE